MICELPGACEEIVASVLLAADDSKDLVLYEIFSSLGDITARMPDKDVIAAPRRIGFLARCSQS